jgi:UDP-N-acetylmuramoylalanine--D-glutamate ligase
MIEATFFCNKKVGVFGLGISGISTLSSLIAGGAKVIAWDDNASNNLQYGKSLQIPLDKILFNIQHLEWETIDYLILSPGIALTHPVPHPIVTLAKRLNIPIICDVEILWNNYPTTNYLGITGSNGKSTTTSLINHIFKSCDIPCQVGGNIGIPVLDLEPMDNNGIYVLELSSFQLDLIDKTTINTAILLNITPDHIDRHGSFENYVESKLKIFRRQKESDIAIIGVDCPMGEKVISTLNQRGYTGQIIRISGKRVLSEGISVVNEVLYYNYHSKNLSFNLGNLQYIPGSHNGQNIAAAFTACITNRTNPEAIINAIKSFKGLKHRMQFIDQINNVIFINDSKATNAEAAEKALLTFDNIFWIAGGKEKEGGIDSLKDVFHKIKHTFLIGEAQNNFAEALNKYQVKYTKCEVLQVAVEQAAKMAFAENLPNSYVVLSPACASYDQWKNFEIRGEAFCKYVQNIKNNLGIAC